MQEDSFQIAGYEGRLISCDWLRPTTTAKKVALIMPGGGYTVDMPLLYYTTEALLARDFQVLLVHTSYRRLQKYRDLAEQKNSVAIDQLIRFESIAVAEDLILRKLLPSVIIGKSAGTFAMTELVPRLNPKSSIWLTPWLRDRWQIFHGMNTNHLVVIGDADPYFPEAKPHLPGHTKIVAGADHSLEISNDLPKTIATLGPIIEWICQHLDSTT